MEKRFPRRYSPSSTPSADTLDPPWFPGWTLLVQDYDAGIPARLVEGGLLCIVEPWTNMEVGDDFKLYWSDGSAPVWSTVVDQNQKNQRLAFRIDEGHIVEGDAFPVFYSVLRSSSTQPVVSQPQWKLLVKLDPPGGFDPDQGTPGHSGLKYSIPQDILDNGVGPDEAAVGVPITIKPYKNMRRRDEINVAWGTENVYHTVAEDEENQEITITIPLEVIERAEDSDALAVAYQVVDECGNYPGGYWRWSAVTHVLVDVNNNRLDPPLVLVDGFPVEEIDLAELAGNPVTVRVTANRYEHAVGDLLRLTWRGTAADSSPVIVGPLEHTVQTIPYYYDFTIPHDDVAAIARGRASVSYVRIRSGEKDLPSKSTSVTVIGDARQYLAPEIVEAVGGTLDPDLSFYTLSVPYYPGRTAGDEIIIICDGRTSTTLPTYHEVTAIVGGEPVGAPVLANLAKEQVKRLDGGSLTVYYSVNGQPESEHLVLSVGVAAPSLPIPTVVEAPNDVLNPDDVNPLIGVNVHATHTATIPEDVVVLRWRGSSSNAPDQSRTLTGNTAGKLVPFTVPFRYVTENLNGTVDVSYSITRGTSLLGNSIVRHLTVGSVLDLKAPSVEEANGAILNPVNAKDKLTVVVPANAALLPEDKLKVTWTGAPGTPAGGSYTSEEWPVRDGWDVPMTNSVVAFNLGKSVTVTYTVIQNGVESPPSDAFVLNVQAMPVASLTIPLIPEAAQGGLGTELDLSKFTGNARVTVAPWPLIAAGQRVWMSCEGIAKDGSHYTIALYTDSEVSSGQVTAGLSTSLSRSELEKLRDGSELKVVLEVTFDRTSNQANAVSFPLRTYRLLISPPLTVDPSLMILDGLSVRANVNWTRKPNPSDSPGNTQQRTASNGVPPYLYRSMNTRVASVTQQGIVTGEGNGETVIEVTDQDGATVRFSVRVSNVVELLLNDSLMSAISADVWRESQRGIEFTSAHLTDLRRRYTDEDTWLPFVEDSILSRTRWTCTPRPLPPVAWASFLVDLGTPIQIKSRTDSVPTLWRAAWCVRPLSV
ncbi:MULTISPECIES: hypothetical protein [unclassified Pseudomonas]|uniref:hypothetical protein n=1 Tax=unclassified Pseudomonas TaxID=196821 RepID=UPI000914E269|nr:MULTISPECIES: hypothetical protein [unclassified Pseudomonas]SFX02786.1 hypothetical protein SAMN03159352_00059 [Pseudomonas sp. NFACC43]SFX15913.1 hypothetical protein SAMN03159442_00738 [Pseudomonas sp. NFACC47-1]